MRIGRYEASIVQFSPKVQKSTTGKVITSPLFPLSGLESRTYYWHWLWFSFSWTERYHPSYHSVKKLPYETDIAGSYEGLQRYKVMKHYRPNVKWIGPIKPPPPSVMINCIFHSNQKKTLWQKLRDLLKR